MQHYTHNVSSCAQGLRRLAHSQIRTRGRWSNCDAEARARPKLEGKRKLCATKALALPVANAVTRLPNPLIGFLEGIHVEYFDWAIDVLAFSLFFFGRQMAWISEKVSLGPEEDSLILIPVETDKP